MGSLRARAVVRLASLLRCRDELLGELTGGALRIVDPWRVAQYDALEAIEFGLGNHPLALRGCDLQRAVQSLQHLKKSRRNAYTLSFLPAFLRRRYLKSESESNPCGTPLVGGEKVFDPRNSP